MSRRGKAAASIVVVLAGAAVALGVFVLKPWSFAASADGSDGAPAVVSGLPATLPNASAAAGSTSDTAAPSAPATSVASETTTAPDTNAADADPTPGQTVATDPPVVVTGSKVPVFVTYSGWDADQRVAVVAGFVPGVVQSNGTCTLTLTEGSRSVVVRSPAHPDASTTECGEMSVPGTKLAPGTWRAVLSYRSPSSSGAAAPVDIEVRS
jgi:hypothetical protein